MEDVGGEIIDISPLVAISLLWPAARQVQIAIQIQIQKQIQIQIQMGTDTWGIYISNVTKHFSIYCIFTHTHTHMLHATNGGTMRPKLKCDVAPYFAHT